MKNQGISIHDDDAIWCDTDAIRSIYQQQILGHMC